MAIEFTDEELDCIYWSVRAHEGKYNLVHTEILRKITEYKESKMCIHEWELALDMKRLYICSKCKKSQAVHLPEKS